MGAVGPYNAAGRRDWYGIIIGKVTLPTAFSGTLAGSVEVEATSGQRLDAKASAGKNKAKTTKHGVEVTKGSVTLTFPAQAFSDSSSGPGVESVLAYLDPNTPTDGNGGGGGGPFAVSHPDLRRRGVKDILITKIGPIVYKGMLGTVKIEWSEWNPDNANNSGKGGAATTTPTSAASAAVLPIEYPLFSPGLDVVPNPFAAMTPGPRI